jgi:DNA primase
MQVLRKGFVDACDWLANEHNVILSEFQPSTEVKKYDFDARKYLRFFEHPFINNLASEFLFNKRHLDPRVIRWCRLNSYKEWLQIPYFDMEGKLIGIQSRYLGADKSQPRFRFPSGNQCHIYNQQIIPMLREGEPLYIAEGCSDCWSLLSAGHRAIAIPSATLLKKEDVTAITHHLPPNTQLYMYPDNDEPGQRLFQQLESLCASGTLSRLPLPAGCKDFSDYYLQCQASQIR